MKILINIIIVVVVAIGFFFAGLTIGHDETTRTDKENALLKDIYQCIQKINTSVQQLDQYKEIRKKIIE